MWQEIAPQLDTDLPLDVLLRSLGRMRHPIPAGASCMFSSLAHQLYG